MAAFGAAVVAAGIVVHSAEDSLCIAAEAAVAAGLGSQSAAGEVLPQYLLAAEDSHSAADRIVVASRKVTDALCLRRLNRSWN